MEKDSSEEEQVSSFKAVLMGALASGVNGPTWNALKTAFLMLGVCLAVMMGLAFVGDDPWLTLHVLFLVVIAVTLFVLLSCMFQGPHLVLDNTVFCSMVFLFPGAEGYVFRMFVASGF